MQETIHPIVCSHCGRELGACGCGRKEYILNRNFTGSATTGEQVLKTFAEKFRLLTQEIDIQGPGSPLETPLFRLRAQLIAQLPAALRATSDFANLDDDILVGARSMGNEAQDALDYSEGGNFHLRTLLIPMGSRNGDLNQLEELVNHYYHTGPAESLTNRNSRTGSWLKRLGFR